MNSKKFSGSEKGLVSSFDRVMKEIIKSVWGKNRKRNKVMSECKS